MLNAGKRERVGGERERVGGERRGGIEIGERWGREIGGEREGIGSGER